MAQVFNHEKKIHDHGLRLTSARRAILKTVASLPHPATISEIVDKTKVDTATVYRNLPVLVAAGILEEIRTEHGTYYALADEHHHDHIVCTNCGRIEHIPCTFTKQRTVVHAKFAKIMYHAVTYYGLCTTCEHSQHSS